MELCRFFVKGHCARGNECFYQHDISNSGLRATATSFEPSEKSSLVSDQPFPPRIPDLPSKPSSYVPVCHFHKQGYCKNGAGCTFRHVDSVKSDSTSKLKILYKDESVSIRQPLGGYDKAGQEVAAEEILPSTDVQDVRGIRVKYGPGAAVMDLQLPSDWSAIRISNIPSELTQQKVQQYLSEFEEAVPLSSIRIHETGKQATILADIRMEDPRFSHRMMRKTAQNLATNKTPDFKVSMIQIGTDSSATSSRLQMSSVICTWYKPSRVAWLHYHHITDANKVVQILNHSPNLGGRKLQASLQSLTGQHGFRRPQVHSVHVSNLNPLTTIANIGRRLGDECKPLKIILGPPSYKLSNDEAQKVVKEMLENVGPLELWEVNSAINAIRVKATARFRSSENAHAAIMKYNASKILSFANSKLFVSPLISIKFNLLIDMYNAIQNDLNDLKPQIWNSGHVHFKAYPATDPLQKLIAVRIYGEDTTSVAKAKSAFEKILAGSAVVSEQGSIWDDFFSTPTGLTYIKELQKKHNVFIYRDNRKSRLSLYGDASCKGKAQSELIQKVQSLSEMSHDMALSPDNLKFVLHGGFRDIIGTLGKKKASLNIIKKIITIKGSTHDLDLAQTILIRQKVSVKKEAAVEEILQTAECVVCLTDAEDPFETQCSHTYCGSCFVSQCSSISEGSIPVRCYGDGGHCLRIFAADELREALPSSTYEQLQHSSLSIYIRSKPQDFQYCCTPDCEHIYRTSTDGLVVTCPACLTPICSTCQVISHDGLTCPEYQRLTSEGNEEFALWKKNNDVKDCPRCKMAIEKTYGCNHMECQICHTHICWFCMEDFDTGGQVYTHMKNTHPAMGIGMT